LGYIQKAAAKGNLRAKEYLLMSEMTEVAAIYAGVNPTPASTLMS